MNNTELNIINKMVQININKRVNFTNLLNENNYTFILIDDDIKIASGSDWKNISDYQTIENASNTQNKIVVDLNTLNINSNFDVSSLKIDNEETKTKTLQDTISTYFLESGSNLHIVRYGESIKLNDDYNYTVCINLLDSTKTEKVNKFIQNNADKKFYIIAANKPTDDSSALISQNVFYLEVGNDLNYLAFVGAYLNNLSLNKPVRDICYARAKSIVPKINNNLEISPLQKWLKNYIINIGGFGMVLGGELVNGENLVNDYMLMLLEKKLKYILFNELANRPKRSEVIGRIYTALISELNNFYTIGAINEEIYSGNNLISNYNGVDYIVAENGEYIKNGYRVYLIDINKQTSEDAKNGILPPLTILLMTNKQPRFIKLNMEIM